MITAEVIVAAICSHDVFLNNMFDISPKNRFFVFVHILPVTHSRYCYRSDICGTLFPFCYNALRQVYYCSFKPDFTDALVFEVLFVTNLLSLLECGVVRVVGEEKRPHLVAKTFLQSCEEYRLHTRTHACTHTFCFTTYCLLLTLT